MEFVLANGITQFAEGEPKRLKCAKQNDAAENLPRMDSALGVLLAGAAVKLAPETGAIQGAFSTYAMRISHFKQSFPWVSPTARNIEPLRGSSGSVTAFASLTSLPPSIKHPPHLRASA